ncbi:hypothetical protein BACFIN_06637 [Bacteroides finegoldii DSM 17565]|nr:hypothetical protein BACFIN_06637 [Bacteroides finegoldii DSM 17565]
MKALQANISFLCCQRRKINVKNSSSYIRIINYNLYICRALFTVRMTY